MTDLLNIIITGVGGQGNVVASQILGQAAVKKGFCVTIGETFGLAAIFYAATFLFFLSLGVLKFGVRLPQSTSAS